MTDFLQWTESDSVGDQAADKEHQKIIRLVNMFLNALVEGKAEKILDSLLEHLIDSVRDHLKKEDDALIKHIERPLFILHKEDGQRIVRELRMLKTSYAKAQLGIDDVLPFFKEWVFTHIREMDQPSYRQMPTLT